MPNASHELTRAPRSLRRKFWALKHPRDVADLLEVPYGHMNYVLYWGKHRYPYRTFTVPKPTGGTRRVEAPPASVAILQSKLNEVLHLVYRPKRGAHGFIRGRGILSNALQHIGKRWVLNVDLQDFFPSIHFGRVRGLFMGRPYDRDASVATVLAQICCHDGRLPQGGVTSPAVSNMICAKLDGELQRLAREVGCTYTRYADDITFSTNRATFPVELADTDGVRSGAGLAIGKPLSSVVAANGFTINPVKSRIQGRAGRQEVTGLVVNRRPNVRRRFVKRVRAMIHDWDATGFDAAQQRHRQRYANKARHRDVNSLAFDRVVRGHLDYLKMVRGSSDPIYRRLANEAHRVSPKLIDEVPIEPRPHPDDLWAQWFDRYKHLVFHAVFSSGGDEHSGTAFGFQPGLLATAAHNTEGDLYISPPLPDDSPVDPSLIRYHSRGSGEIDAAVIAIPKNLFQTRRLPIRKEPVNPGESVAAIGFPTIPGKEPAVGIHPGIVESTARDYRLNVDHIQVTIESSGGMSGSPVIDREGRLIGIAIEGSFEKTQGGVPSREFRHVLPIAYVAEFA